MKYLVEVNAPLPDDLEAAARQIAATFGIPLGRVLVLLGRAPGIVTKPLDEDEANRVLDAFGAVDIRARMLPYDPAAPTVLDRVLDAAGSEPVRAVRRRAAAIPPVPAALPSLEGGVSPEADVASAPPTEGVADLAVEHASAAPEAARRSVIVPRFDDVQGLDLVGLGEADLDMTDPGLGERSRRIYAALDAAIEQTDAEVAKAAAKVTEAAAVVDDEPPVVVATDLDEALPSPEDAPPPATSESPNGAASGATSDDERSPGFDAHAFTQALLDEHGLDDSLLDDLETEVEGFNLSDRAERLTVEESPVDGSAPRKQRSPFLSRVEEPAVDERGAIAVPIGLDDEPTPMVLEPDVVQRPRRRRTGRRRGLRSKVLLAGLFPSLLTVIFALAAVAVTVRPALWAQQIDVASSAASAFAAALSTRQIDAALDSTAAAAEIQRAALEARPALLEDGIDLLLVTDAAGAPLAGWSLVSTDPQQVVRDAAPLLVPALEAALGRPVAVVVGPVVSVPAPDRIATAPLLVAGNLAGAVVIGSDPIPVDRQARTLLLIVLAAVVIPLLIAFVVSASLTGSLLHNLELLTRAADRISRGKLARPVELDTGDELSELARAIERMRISLQEGMERLRRRRQ